MHQSKLHLLEIKQSVCANPCVAFELKGMLWHKAQSFALAGKLSAVAQHKL